MTIAVKWCWLVQVRRCRAVHAERTATNQQADAVVTTVWFLDVLLISYAATPIAFSSATCGYHRVPQEEINQILLRKRKKANAWCG
ncbi:hypothetical protein ACNKHV_21115 [Shigella flexneri]